MTSGGGTAEVGRVRVLVYATAAGSGGGAVEAAYHHISAELAGTPGLLGNTLMRSLRDDAGFVVLSEWTDVAAFRAWESGAAHRQATSPLRPYQDVGRGSAFGIYEVIAAY
jgi:heme-degrading monooxygenase HmoA